MSALAEGAEVSPSSRRASVKSRDEVLDRTARWYRSRRSWIRKWRERTPRRITTLGSRRRSAVIQIVKYSLLSVLRRLSLIIDLGSSSDGEEVQVPLRFNV